MTTIFILSTNIIQSSLRSNNLHILKIAFNGIDKINKKTRSNPGLNYLL